MNRIHSKVWNASFGTLVVASEHARSRGKGGSIKRRCLAAAAAIALGMGGFVATASAGDVCDANGNPIPGATAAGNNALACGNGATSKGDNSVAVGNGTTANGTSSAAVGDGATANRDGTIAFGQGATAGSTTAPAGEAAYDNDVAIGTFASATGGNSAATGMGSNASGMFSSAYGGLSQAGGNNSTAIGSFSSAAGANSTALGSFAVINSDNGVALGANTIVSSTGTDSNVALGTNSQATGATLANAAYNPSNAALAGAAPIGEVSIGSAGAERRITNLAAGSGATDAVNVSQLQSTDARVTALENRPVGGNGVAAGTGNGLAVGATSHAGDPTDTAVGNNANVGADGSTAVGANSTITASATNSVAVGQGTSVTAPSGTALGQGSSVSAANATALGQGSVADRANTVSVGTAGATRQITNVAAGTQATDAANTGQVDQALTSAKAYANAGDQNTLNQANAYTNQAIIDRQGDLNNFRNEVNDRFHAVDRRIDRVGAMGAASTQMAINAAGATGNGKIAAGVGFEGGRSALAVGYAAPLSPRTHISFGATASGSETSTGIGFGVDL